MQDSSSQKLTAIFIIVVHLAIQCNATAFSVQSCARGRLGFRPHSRRCPPLRISETRLCSLRKSLCSLYPDLGDCLVPQFQCALNSRCIPRRRVCNGFPDCSDGSDEWGCEASLDYTDTRHLESIKTTSSYITTASTILRGNQEKTTNMVRTEDNTTSSPPTTTTSRMLPNSESNTALSSSTTTMSPDSESNTALSSSTTTMSPDSESNTTPSSTTIDAMFSHFERNTTLPSSSTTKTMIPDSEWNTADLSSSTKIMILHPDSESKLTASTPATIMKMIPAFEADIPLSTFLTNSIILSQAQTAQSPEKSHPTNTFPETSAMKKCPDNHCMHNAECIVVQGQYRCRCPSSFFGELCEIKLGTERVFYEYTVVIAISVTLAILCLVVSTICIYRYKRLSWKFSDKTTRTLSQLTLTSNAVE